MNRLKKNKSVFERNWNSFANTWSNCVCGIVCLSNRATESNCLAVAGDDMRIEFDGLLIRIGLVSRVKNDDEWGDKLVPAEFGGVRCLFGLSSVNWRRKIFGPVRLVGFLEKEQSQYLTKYFVGDFTLI